MKAPKYIAASVCLILVFLMFQAEMWHWRPEPGWQPSWWQSETLSTLGACLSLPAIIPVGILAAMEASNESLAHLAVVFGYILEIGLTYWFVYSLTKFLFSRRYETRKTRATA